MIEYFSTLIENYGTVALVASFGIGILTSLAPCSIVVIPLIIGFAANTNIIADDIKRARFTRNFTLMFTLGVVLSITVLFFAMSQFQFIINTYPVVGYFLAASLSTYIGLSGFGILKGISFHEVAKRFMKYKLYGALIMGILIGVVSAPCSSPAIASILIVAKKQSFVYALSLVMVFALGHSIVLIISGLSINFVQYISQKRLILLLTGTIQKITAAFLLIIGVYFFYRVYILGSLSKYYYY